MRILHILDHSIPIQSGYTFRTCAILQEQQKLGWETYHLTSGKQGSLLNEEETVDGFHFFRTRKTATFLNHIPLVNQISIVHNLKKRIAAICRQVQPDIIHAHSPVLNGLAALSVARNLNIPLVYEVRAFWEDAAVDHGTHTSWGLRYRITRALETRILKQAQAITAICQGLYNEIVLRSIAPEKITVVPNAVDIEQFHPVIGKNAALAQQMQLNGKIVLGFLGSFYAYEGLSLLIDTLPEIIHRHPKVRLLLVGGGPQEAQLRQQVRDNKLDDIVIFTGRIPHQQIINHYSLVDILVYPRLSIRLTELATPLKPLEAMAMGKLILASNIGGHRELIHHNVNGWLFQADDRNDLVNQLDNLINARERWPILIDNGKIFVKEQRNWRISVQKYQAIYNHLVKHKK